MVRITTDTGSLNQTVRRGTFVRRVQTVRPDLIPSQGMDLTSPVHGTSLGYFWFRLQLQQAGGQVERVHAFWYAPHRGSSSSARRRAWAPSPRPRTRRADTGRFTSATTPKRPWHCPYAKQSLPSPPRTCRWPDGTRPPPGFWKITPTSKSWTTPSARKTTVTLGQLGDPRLALGNCWAATNEVIEENGPSAFGAEWVDEVTIARSIGGRHVAILVADADGWCVVDCTAHSVRIDPQAKSGLTGFPHRLPAS
ncbi:hypothetical protein ACVWZ7_003883 [Arthrobacter sp. TE12232]